jgi:hypothetical protein
MTAFCHGKYTWPMVEVPTNQIVTHVGKDTRTLEQVLITTVPAVTGQKFLAVFQATRAIAFTLRMLHHERYVVSDRLRFGNASAGFLIDWFVGSKDK